MKIISFGKLKGGVGSSTAVFNVGGLLAEEGKKVLLIDVDMQANLSSNCGIDITNPKIKSVKDIFENKTKPEEIVIKSPIQELPTLDIIPSSIFLFKTSELVYQYPNRDMTLSRYINKHKDFFEQYDHVLIDTNPSMSCINVNAFLASDSIVVVMDGAYNSFIGASLFAELWDNIREAYEKEDNIAALSIQNFNPNSNYAKDFLELCHTDSFSKDIILSTVIKSAVKVKEADIHHLPLCLYDPKHPVVGQFKDLVKELREREVL